MPDAPEMPENPTPTEPESPAARRRRLEKIFGEVLPDTTSDERDAGTDTSSEDAGEAWLRAQVPPHHG